MFGLVGVLDRFVMPEIVYDSRVLNLLKRVVSWAWAFFFLVAANTRRVPLITHLWASHCRSGVASGVLFSVKKFLNTTWI